MKKITLADIAKETGYSVNTVSHALRDMKDISEGVKAYINDTAKKMGYIPNIAAGALRSGKTKHIALISNDITIPFFSHIAKETELLLRKKGYSLTIMNTLSDKELTHSAILSAISKNVDGIILFSTPAEADKALIAESSVPCVAPKPEDTLYSAENEGYLLGEHLTALGHRRILFLADSSVFSEGRESGIKKALDEVSGTLFTERENMQKALNKNSDCSAVVCSSIAQSHYAYKIFVKDGKNIPDDISLAVFSLKEEESPFNITSAGVSAKVLAQKLLSGLPDLTGDGEIPSVTAILTEGETTKEPSRRFTAKKALSDYLL